MYGNTLASIIHALIEKSRPNGQNFVMPQRMEPQPEQISILAQQFHKLERHPDLRSLVNNIGAMSLIFYEACLTPDQWKRDKVLQPAVAFCKRPVRPEFDRLLELKDRKSSSSTAESVLCLAKELLELAERGALLALRGALTSDVFKARVAFDTVLGSVDAAAECFGYPTQNPSLACYFSDDETSEDCAD